MDENSNNYLKYLSDAQKDGVVFNTKRTLERISDSRINSFICVNPDAIAMAEKLESELNSGKSLPLAGLPVGIKDNIDVKGIPTTCASKVLNRPANSNAECVERIIRAGGIIIGKTNMDEFAMGSGNVTSAFGPVLNPNDNSLVPGGSSGGSAAAVAAGLVPFALGSDTGGSIRQPAACCSIVGFKPCVEDVDRRGLVVTVPALDSIGVLGCDTAACKALYQIISNKALSSPSTDGLKIAYIDSDFADCDKEVKEDFAAALELLGKSFFIRKIEIPILKDAIDIYGEMSCKCNAEALKEIYHKYGNMLSPETKRRVSAGLAQTDDTYYKKALEAREVLSKAMQRVFESFDVIISPTSPLLPFGLNETPRINPDIFTQPASLANLPAISLPLSKRGTAIQIISRKGREDLLFALSERFEKGFTKRQ